MKYSKINTFKGDIRYYETWYSSEYNGIYELYDVIFDHSKFAGRDDDEALDQFREIMYRENTSAEECYEALK